MILETILVLVCVVQLYVLYLLVVKLGGTQVIHKKKQKKSKERGFIIKGETDEEFINKILK